MWWIQLQRLDSLESVLSLWCTTAHWYWNCHLLGENCFLRLSWERHLFNIIFFVNMKLVILDYMPITIVDLLPHDFMVWFQVQIHDGLCALQWRHNEPDGVLNQLRLDCLLNRLFRCRSIKTSKFRVTVLCAGNSQVTGEFPTQRASNSENVSIWWRHHIVKIVILDYMSITLAVLATSRFHLVVSSSKKNRSYHVMAQPHYLFYTWLALYRLNW